MKKGDKYRHFKGMIVEILEIAKDSETLEDMVVYRHTDTDEIWVRPLSMFLSKVDTEKYPDVKQEYRFEKIN
jgi:hypothetical protein